MTAAVLMAVLIGAFGTAAGSWLGARALADLPDGTHMADLTRRAAAVNTAPDILLQTSPWVADRVSAGVTLDSNWDAAQARQRYAAAGWSISGVMVVHDRASVLDPATRTGTYIPTRYDRFTAESGGLIVEISGMSIGNESTVQLVGWAADSPMFPVFLVTGLALGLITGWLLAAALARRVRAAHPAHRATLTAFATTGMFVLAVPAVALYNNLVRALRPHDQLSGPLATVHGALSSHPYWSTMPGWLLPALGVAGGLLAVVTLALAAWPQPIRLYADDDPAGPRRDDGDFTLAGGGPVTPESAP